MKKIKLMKLMISLLAIFTINGCYYAPPLVTGAIIGTVAVAPYGYGVYHPRYYRPYYSVGYNQGYGYGYDRGRYAAVGYNADYNRRINRQGGQYRQDNQVGHKGQSRR